MNEETVNSLLSSFDQVVDDYFDKAILSDADHQVLILFSDNLFSILYNWLNSSNHK